MNVRKYDSKDCKSIAELFHDTVHSVNAADYSETQLNAWAPKDIDLLEWDNALSSNYSIVVEKDDTIIGFGVADNTGYFDRLYTHKDYQGIGVATLIADEIERYFRRLGVQIVTTAASITAKPFFEKRGYVVLTEQCVERRGELLVNYAMKKILST